MSHIVLSILYTDTVWLKGVNSLMTFIGLISAALAIVMKDVIMNMAGWFYIVLKSPFKVGDRVEIDGVAGDVVDIQLFSFESLHVAIRHQIIY